MKVTVDRAAFAGVLDTISKFVPRTHIKDEYMGVELSAHNGLLFVRAGDEVKGMLTDMPAEIVEEGLIIIKHATLSGLVKNYQTDKLQLQADEKKLSVGSGKSKYTLGLINPDKFTTMPAESEKKPTVIYGLGDALKRCSYTQTKHEFGDEAVRPDQMVFGNICVDSGRCVAVAQDKARMAVVKHETGDLEQFLLPTILIPFLKELDNFEVMQNGNWLFLYTEKGTMYVRKGEGDFPTRAVDGIMNKPPVTTAIVNKTELINALSRLCQVSSVGGLVLTEGGLHLVSQYQAHKGEEDIACEVKGELFEYIITNFLFVELLKSCTSDTIKLGFVGVGPSPIYIYDGNDVHVVMSRTA